MASVTSEDLRRKAKQAMADWSGEMIWHSDGHSSLSHLPALFRKLCSTVSSSFITWSLPFRWLNKWDSYKLRHPVIHISFAFLLCVNICHITLSLYRGLVNSTAKISWGSGQNHLHDTRSLISVKWNVGTLEMLCNTSTSRNTFATFQY